MKLHNIYIECLTENKTINHDEHRATNRLDDCCHHDSDLERGMGMYGPEDPLSCLSRSSQESHFKQKSLKISSQDPLLRQIWK